MCVCENTFVHHVKHNVRFPKVNSTVVLPCEAQTMLRKKVKRKMCFHVQHSCSSRFQFFFSVFSDFGFLFPVFWGFQFLRFSFFPTFFSNYVSVFLEKFI